MNYSDELMVQCFRIAHELSDTLQIALEGCGITSNNYCMLQLIVDNPGIRQHVISEITKKNKALVTQVVTKFEDAGLITRETVENDRRSYELYATEKGQKMVDEHFPVLMEAEADLLSCLSEEEQQTVRRLIKKMFWYIKEKNTNK